MTFCGQLSPTLCLTVEMHKKAIPKICRSAAPKMEWKQPNLASATMPPNNGLAVLRTKTEKKVITIFNKAIYMDRFWCTIQNFGP